MAIKISQLDPALPLSGSELFEIVQSSTSYATSANAIANYSQSKIQPNNTIINSNAEIWQRGTSFTSVPEWTADHWYASKSTAGDFSVIRSTLSPAASAGELGQYSFGMQCTTADASVGSSDWAVFFQRVEGNQIQELIGQDCVLAFWVRSSKTGTHHVTLRNSAANRTLVMPYTVNQVDTWERKEIQFYFDYTGTWTIGAATIGLSLYWVLMSGTDVQAPSAGWFDANYFGGTSDQVNLLDSTDNWFRITKIQLCRGKKAPPYTYDFALDHKRCEKFYQRCSTSTNGQHIWSANVTSGQTYYGTVWMSTKMIGTPTVTLTYGTDGNMDQTTLVAQTGGFQGWRWRCGADGTGRGFLRFSWIAEVELT